jgi:hypothetical protein
MEVMRLTDVLEKHLATRTYLVNEEYSIADMVCYPWFQQLRTGMLSLSLSLYLSLYLSIYLSISLSLSLTISLSLSLFLSLYIYIYICYPWFQHQRTVTFR